MTFLKINLKNEKSYIISQQDFRKEMERKKCSPRYNKNGVATNIRQLKVLKHEKLAGPFAVAIFENNMDMGDEKDFSYQGVIILNEDEFAYVYRDSLEDGYTEAYFCDDNTLLMDIRNTATREKTAVRISGEPTGTQSWDWDDPYCDTEDHQFKKLVDDTMAALEKKYDFKVYGVVKVKDLEIIPQQA